MTITSQLQSALNQQGLTIYGASQIVSAETDDSLKAIHKRISRYLDAVPPTSLRQLEEVCNALGYEIQLVKR